MTDEDTMFEERLRGSFRGLAPSEAGGQVGFVVEWNK